VSAYASPSEGGNRSKSDIPTGILTPPSDPKALAEALTFLIEHSSLLRTMGANAARDARLRFDLQTQVDAYLEWYEEIIEEHGQRATA
jgi:O-antigen biosynthesis rhamnosyltransferase